MQKWIIRIVSLIIFIVCIALIVAGQKTVGVPNLIKMLVGVLGILALLFVYNKKHQ